MMKYQPTNYNFIPKEERNKIDHQAILGEKQPAQGTKPVMQENLTQINQLKEQLKHSQNQLTALENELFLSNRKVLDFEEKLQKIQAFSPEVHDVSSLSAQIQQLTEENETLQKDLKKSKDHVQTLYFILVLVAVL